MSGCHNPTVDKDKIVADLEYKLNNTYIYSFFINEFEVLKRRITVLERLHQTFLKNEENEK